MSNTKEALEKARKQRIKQEREAQSLRAVARAQRVASPKQRILYSPSCIRRINNYERTITLELEARHWCFFSTAA